MIYGHYPKEVYLIFPFDENGNAAGVYVGASSWVEERIRNHLYSGKSEPDNQKEAHLLMKENGFSYTVVDTIEDFNETHIEYDWIDFFLKNTDLRVFNSLKIGLKNADWKRLNNPMKHISFIALNLRTKKEQSA